MGKFELCLRVALGGAPSHAWIALHRCVEANSGLTGESFRSIFTRLEQAHGFERTSPARWPSLAQIHAAAGQLEHERRTRLDEYRALVTVRRAEKQAGRRQRRDERLDQLERERGRIRKPKVGCWGWAKREHRC